MKTIEVNLEHDAFVEGVPYETFAWMRKEAPLYWYDWKQGKGFGVSPATPIFPRC